MPTLSELAFEKENLLKCKGYDPKFISKQKPISAQKPLSKQFKSLLPEVEGNKKGILNYTGLSVLYNKKRKVPFYAAYNIDGSGKANKTTRPAFRPDPRIKENLQLGFAFYDLDKKRTEFEIGHMASNNEMGRGKDGKLRAYQTFHFSNSVPQAEKLNSGIWQGLERYIVTEAATLKSNKRICVFTGPMLKKNDPKYIKDESFRIPLLFFKVIIFPTSKGVFSTAFMMSHEKKLITDKMFASGPQALTTGAGLFDDFKYKKVFQVDISFVEKETGLKFSWQGVKKVKVPNVKNQIKKIKNIQDAAEANKAIKEGDVPESLLKKIKPKDKEAVKKSIRNGLVPEALLSNADLTPKELKRNKFKLNMVLP